jgi:hypothetical protein
MWEEPLTPAVEDLSAHEFRVFVVDAARRPVAHVVCAISREARTGIFGEMQTLRDDGTQRQRVRALVLLVRAALAHAADAGVRRVVTDVPDIRSVREFAQRMTGIDGQPRRHGRRRFIGDLADIRTHVLERTTDAGDER